MFGLSIWELLIVLAIVIFVFGPSRLKTIGTDLGGAIKGFRGAIKDDPAEKVEDSSAGSAEVASETAKNAASGANQKSNV